MALPPVPAHTVAWAGKQIGSDRTALLCSVKCIRAALTSAWVADRAWKEDVEKAQPEAHLVVSMIGQFNFKRQLNGFSKLLK